ncbi:MAG: hypothetical protein RLZ98_2006 [Pseudomonadota bacterium]|jgi:peptide/nickel transport system substrate-binding protein
MAHFSFRARLHRATALLLASILLLAPGVGGVRAGAGSDQISHGIAMHGATRLDPGFDHFPYVNPAAPKGGSLRLGRIGTFDSLNPFIVRGNSPEGMRGYVFESLMARSSDEAFSLYGLIASGISVSADRSSITFHLRPEAKFSDGRPITSADVVFSHRVLRAKGQPFMRSHYSRVEHVTALDAHTVRFDFKALGDRELALIVGLMPILPAHLFDEASFDQTTLRPVVGSGPYVLGEIVPGRRVSFVRNPDYWGWHVAANKGRHNFDTVRIEYFRDDGAMFEAFKAGQIDLRQEDDPARWGTGYDFPGVRRGDVVLREEASGWPAGMLALAFNTRRHVFQDRRVRRAFIEMFHFSEINRLLYNGLFKRSDSFFARSSLAAAGVGATADERRILAGHEASVSEQIMAGTVPIPSGAAYQPLRPRLENAYRLLKDAGYEVRGNALVHTGSGRQLSFEFLAASKAQERLVLAFARTLRRMGIAVRIRQVDSSQYWSRLKSFDFDMIQWRWPASLSPGNEQIHRWTSRYADIEGSLNYPGVREPAVDVAISAMLAAKERAEFEAAVRVLDRVLLSGDYVIPLFHAESQWIAHWRHLSAPKVSPLTGTSLDTWWYDPAPARP